MDEGPKLVSYWLRSQVLHAEPNLKPNDSRQDCHSRPFDLSSQAGPPPDVDLSPQWLAPFDRITSDCFCIDVSVARGVGAGFNCWTLLLAEALPDRCSNIDPLHNCVFEPRQLSLAMAVCSDGCSQSDKDKALHAGQ